MKEQTRARARVTGRQLYGSPLPFRATCLGPARNSYFSTGIHISDCVIREHRVLLNLFVDGFTTSVRREAAVRGPEVAVL